MDIWRLLGAALRRWYVMLPMLALTAVAALGLGNQVQPEYTAGGSVLLTAPAESPGGNPYADMDTASRSVSIVLMSGPTRAEFRERGLSDDFEVAGVSRTPILQFTVRASTPEVAVATAQALVDETSLELAGRQSASGVDDVFQVKADVLEAPTGAASTGQGQFQAQVAVAGIGVVVAFLAAVFFDDLVLLWRQRRERRALESASGSPRMRGRKRRSSKTVSSSASVSPPSTRDEQDPFDLGSGTPRDPSLQAGRAGS